MFKPKYVITEALLSNIKKIAILIEELNSQRYPKVVLVEMERSARALSAHSSTSIEGNPLPLTEVKKLLKQSPSSIRDTEKEVLNYNTALEYLNDLSEKTKSDLTPKLILHIHQMIMSGLLEKFNLGKFRSVPVFVNDPVARRAVYWPPDSQDVPTLISELTAFIKDNFGKIDPLILAGIFHKQFVIIHPFTDGNGRTARLSTKVLLAGLGISTFNLFSFENFYNKNVTEYFKKVGVLGNYYDLKDETDFTAWLQYFTNGIIDELLRVKKELENVSITPENILKSHHKKILEQIEKMGFTTDAEYAKITTRAKATRNQDFNKLIDLHFIKREGKGKGTFYKKVML